VFLRAGIDGEQNAFEANLEWSCRACCPNWKEKRYRAQTVASDSAENRDGGERLLGPDRSGPRIVQQALRYPAEPISSTVISHPSKADWLPPRAAAPICQGDQQSATVIRRYQRHWVVDYWTCPNAIDTLDP